MHKAKKSWSTELSRSFDRGSGIEDDIMQSEPEDFDEIFQQFLEAQNNCFETRTDIHLPLYISPPSSCPVTPTISETKYGTVNTQEFQEGKCQTDTPELESYLKQFNPLQGNTRKRKSDNISTRKKIKACKKAKNNRNTQKLYRRPSADDVEAYCVETSMKWENFNCEHLYELYDSSFVLRTSPILSVTCDKGISLSPTENVYICQKKNHFQITVVLENAPETETFIKIKDSYENVLSYKVHLYAVKAESSCSKIDIDQSTADRCKHQYHPVRISSKDTGGTKTLTIGRLHFSETTTNNMRKRGKLNPDQRYFLLVVEIRAYTKQGNYPICCEASEKIIVRASNPGQFETATALWSKGKNEESINTLGKVGINNDKPEHSLSVNGNIRLTGRVFQPADERLIELGEQVDTQQHLENISNLNIYKYRVRNEYGEHAGFELNSDSQEQNVGVLGREVEKLIPNAVTKESSITLPSGNTLKDVVLVDKDRLLMESLGAIQELYKVSQILTSRLFELERKNDIMEIILKNSIQINDN